MKRIKYISQFAKDLKPDEIASLVSHAAKKNVLLEITGILMTSGRVFYQVIEGPEAHIDDVFESIASDPRHQDVLLLESESSVTSRFFPDWSMKKIDLDAHASERLRPVRELLGRVMEKRREIAQLTDDIERIIWYELASMVSDSETVSDSDT